MDIPELNSRTFARAKEILARAGYDVVRSCPTDVKEFDRDEFQEYLDKHTDMKV